MKPLEILQYPHPILSQKSRPVEEWEIPEIVQLSKAATRTLTRTKYGVGLSANQVGDTRRWFVSPQFKLCINPEVVEASEETSGFGEGCLSRPGMTWRVQRPARVKVKWISHKGTVISRSLSGLPAKIFLHELDHLDGKNVWDLAEEQGIEGVKI